MSKRETLKSYFQKGDRPTEANFAELIDFALITEPDGVVEAAGASVGLPATVGGEVLRLFEAWQEDAPADWTLGLKALADPADPTSEASGLSIAGQGGEVRVFIDKATGKLGIGTAAPGETLSAVTETGRCGLELVGKDTTSEAPHIRLVHGDPAAPASEIRLTASADALAVLGGGLAVDDGTTRLRQEDWHAAALLGPWANHGGGYNPAGFFKDSLGIVHLRGLVSAVIGGDSDRIMFDLPAGYRPENPELQLAPFGPGVPPVAGARPIQIGPDGQVRCNLVASVVTCLDGITFRAAP